MTHEEIYYKALKSFPYGDLSSIQRAIRIAIEEERAECAKIVEAARDGIKRDNYNAHLAKGFATSIAERIRARSTASTRSAEPAEK